jgi:hypothetical protein
MSNEAPTDVRKAGSSRPAQQQPNSQDSTASARDLRGQAGEAMTKLTDAAQQAGRQAKGSATSLASQANETAKGMINEQIAKGAGMVGHIADSIGHAADHLDSEAPQLASLVRSAAETSKDFSRDMQDKSVEEVFQSASDFTRRQPALVFGSAAVAGFFLFRLLKSGTAAKGSSGTSGAGSGRQFYQNRSGGFRDENRTGASRGSQTSGFRGENQTGGFHGA